MSVLIRATVRKAILPGAMPFTSLFGVLLACGASGCSSLDAASDTCLSVGNALDPLCQSGAGGTAGTDGVLMPPGPPPWEQARFACLNPDLPPPTAPMPPADATVNLTAVIVDYANPTMTPLTNLSIAFCQQQDRNCDSDLLPKAVPVGMGPAFNIAVPARSNGYLRQEAMDHFRQDYYLLAPMLRDDASLAMGTKAFFLVGNDSLAGFLSDMGIDVDPDLGIMAFFIEDCNGDRVEGATLRLPEAISGTRPDLRNADFWAINSVLPVVDAVTEADGTAGFVNVALGTVQVEVVVNGWPYGQARLRVAGGRLTAATLRPFYTSGR